MTPRINDVLANIRHKLEVQESTWRPVDGAAAPRNESWGPDVTGVSDGSFLGGSAGEGGADNVSPAQDQLDEFLNDIAVQLSQAYDVDLEGAFEFIYSVADDMAEQELLPPLPDDDASDEDAGFWQGTAETAGFGQHVMAMARDQFAK